MIEYAPSPTGPHPWEGKIVVITGQLSRFSRPEASALARMLGAEVAGSVDHRTSFVVVGAVSGRRANQALKLGVPTYDERKFIQAVIEAMKEMLTE